MNTKLNLAKTTASVLLLLILSFCTCFAQGNRGEKTAWHGFDRYDYVISCDQPDGHSAVDMELLAQGFYIVIAPVPYNADGPIFDHWNIVYDYLVEKGFSSKPVLAGRGAATGEMYTWAIENPGKTSCIYGENPILRSSLAKIQPMDNLKSLATAKIPIIHVCGASDPNLKTQTNEVKKRYAGKMTLIIDKDRGHYPIEPNDPAKIAKLITQTIK